MYQAPPPQNARASVARKITLIGGGFLLAVIGTICAVMVVMLAKRAQERTVTWVDAKVQAVAQSLDAYDQTSKLLVERFFKVFGDQFGKNFALDEANGKLSQLGIALNEYHNPCDKFTEFTGGAAAVLMKKGNEFVAISTSVKDAKGERAVGMAVGNTHPAYAPLLKGQPYLGRATLYGRPYITRLQPVRDLQDHIVGALFVAFDLTEFDRSLEEMVASTRFFDTGGVVLIDPRHGDDAVIALPANLRGRTLAEVGGAGRTLLAAVQESGAGNETKDFKPLLKPGATDRFAVARPSAATGWWVVGEASSSEAMRTQWLTLMPFLALFGLAALALCAGLYVLMRRWIGAPLRTLTTALDAVAGGDLSTPVHTERQDEIGEMMRGVETMRVRFVEMLGEVRTSADTISTASQEIASGNQDLSRRTEEASARLQQTTSAMEQIYGNVRQAAEAARTADQLACGASQAAQRGGEAVSQVVAKMSSISASSQRITDITGVIDAIAFQTNLLALNAAVEAARAGDSGRGFAVVAGEVRNLARRAAEAAKEIKQLIGSSVAEIRSGSALADTANDRMQEIVASVHRVNETLVTITASTQQQSESLGEVNGSVSTLDHMTQQNAALVEQSAAAADSLQSQASRLVQAMAIFRFEAEPEVTSEEMAL
jgi:methyl-accepting chemotaxis protein-2 (aspartate sensor receptor)